MLPYEIAGLPVCFDAKYPTLLRNSAKYKKDMVIDPVAIYISPEEMNALEADSPHLSADQREYMLFGKSFYHYLITQNGLMLHASAVVVDNEAYLFSAPSGTGKSTHTSLWLEYFGSRSYILNDDKPAIRIFPDGIYAYGTPFSGKYDISVNQKVPLKGIAFVERSASNSIVRQTPQQALYSILNQTTRPANIPLYTKLLSSVGELIARIPVYTLQCNISREAVLVSYEEMRKG